MKKFICTILTLMLLTASLPVNAFAETVSELPNTEGYATFNGHTYFVPDQSMTWENAKAYCEALGGHLISITSEEEQNFIYEYLLGKDLDGHDFWIGLSSSNGFSWDSWITGEAVSYSNWGYGEPDNLNFSQHFGVLCLYDVSGYGWSVKHGQWDDIQNASRKFICEWDSADSDDSEPAPSEPVDNIQDWLFSGSSYYDEENGYFVLTKDNTAWEFGAIWYKAPQYSDFIIEMDYYTGTTNRPMGGADGMTVAFYADYQNGTATQFDKCNGYGVELDTYSNSSWNDISQNHIALIKDSIGNHLTSVPLSESEDEKWHHLKVVVENNICSAFVDNEFKFSEEIEHAKYGWIGILGLTGDGTNLHAVKNIVISASESDVFQGHRYKVYDEYMTWEEAKAFCESVGGHLATITSEEENNFISNLLEKATRNNYFIGATDSEEEGAWKWITGEKWEYTNWSDSSPDNYLTREHYLSVYNFQSTQWQVVRFSWNDCSNIGYISGDDSGYWKYSSQFGFICEWENSDISTNINTKDYGKANFKVLNSQTLEPIDDAFIFFQADEQNSNTFKTDSNGTVSPYLPKGRHTLKIYADGYKTRTITVNITEDENTIPDIGLSSREPVSGSLTFREMTLEEIEEAGIDISAPENQHVFEYTAKITFKAEIDWLSIVTYFNADGTFLFGKFLEIDPPDYGVIGPTNPGDPGNIYPGYDYPGVVWGSDRFVQRPIIDSDGINRGVEITLPSQEVLSVYPVSEEFYVIIHGEARWLKEMFDIELLVMNESLTDTIENCTAELNLPDGLSLATMKQELGQQTLVAKIPFIDKGASESVHWYIRGDIEGSYDLSATLKGTLMPFEEDFEYKFVTSKPLQVYAGSALHMTFSLPTATFYNDDYNIKITLENVSDKPIYNLQHIIKYFEQGQVTHYSDGSVKEVVHVKKDNPISISAKQFNPGDKLVIEITTNIMFESELIKYQLDKLVGVVDGIEKLTTMISIITSAMDLIDGFTTLLEDAVKSVDNIILAADTIELAELKSELAKEIQSMINLFAKGNGSSIVLSSKLKDSDIFKLLSDLASVGNADDSYEIDSLLTLSETVEQLRAINSAAEKATATEEFNIFESIRTAISLIPIRFVLDDVVITTLENSTTTIPCSVEYIDVGARYFGVESVSKYLYALEMSAIGEMLDVDLGLFGLRDPFDDAREYVKATEKEALEFAAKEATGATTFKAYFIPSSGADYKLTSTNKNTVNDDDGSISFNGSGIIEFTPNEQINGTLYIESDDGYKKEIEIETVEPHTCSGEKWVITIPATAESSGLAVKICDVCDDICDTKSVSFCGNHEFCEEFTEIAATHERNGIKTKTCEACGHSVSEIIPKLTSGESSGDVNGDGRVNVGDIVLMAQYLSMWSIELDESIADVSGDGAFNIADLVLLAQYLAGWNVSIS